MDIIEHINIKPVIYARDTNTELSIHITVNKQIQDILAGIQLPSTGLELEPLDNGQVIHLNNSLTQSVNNLNNAIAKLAATTAKLELLAMDTNNIFN